MRLFFLGTAAAEGYPAIFCQCANCHQARLLGGRNLRHRSALLVNDDLLIDFGEATCGHDGAFVASDVQVPAGFERQKTRVRKENTQDV